MDLRIVTVGALKAFIESPEFALFPNVPITPLRAISQAQNPKALASDPVLVVAYDESNEIMAYFGCLPDVLRTVPSEKICWSSCWWVHPEKGKAAAMPVFYKALQLWEGKMLFDALPQRSQNVLERMGFFSFQKIEGLHAFLRFKWHKIIPAKFPVLASLKSFFYVFDALLNIPIRVRLAFWKWRKALPPNIRINRVESIDEATEQFIKELAANDLMQRNAETFNWIIQYPWLNSSSKYKDRYHFSAQANQFEQILLQVFQEEEMIAFLWLTHRDGTVKLPYSYISPGKEKIAAVVVAHQLHQYSADTFICFQANFLEAFRKNAPPFLYKKEIAKVFGWSKELSAGFEPEYYIQDGDGDGVFT